MAFPNKLSQLCTPSYIYFILSIVAVVISGVQNMGNRNIYNLGMFSCHVPSCIAIFAMKIIYILFWTWVLNLMCKDGHTEVAWFLVLLPFLLFFVIIGTLMIYQRKNEPRREKLIIP
jgi:H+/Cl- antiporter ClcA